MRPESSVSNINSTRSFPAVRPRGSASCQHGQHLLCSKEVSGRDQNVSYGHGSGSALSSRVFSARMVDSVSRLFYHLLSHCQVGSVSKEMRYKIMRNIAIAFIRLGQARPPLNLRAIISFLRAFCSVPSVQPRSSLHKIILLFCQFPDAVHSLESVMESCPDPRSGSSSPHFAPIRILRIYPRLIPSLVCSHTHRFQFVRVLLRVGRC